MVCQRLKQHVAFGSADILQIVADCLYKSRDQEAYRIFKHRPVAVAVGVLLQYLVFEHAFEFATEIGVEVVLEKIDVQIEILLQKIEYVFEKRLGIGQYRSEIELVEHARDIGDYIVVYLFYHVGSVVVMQIERASADIGKRTYLFYRQLVDGHRVQKLNGRGDDGSLRLSYSPVLGHKNRLLVKKLTKRAIVYCNEQ